MGTINSLATDQQSKQTNSPISGTKALWAGILFSFLFTLLIWVVGGRLHAIELLPDTGGGWYYWQLPNATFWTRLSAWGSYTLHQVAIWGLIFYAQKNKLRYTNNLHPVNIVALGVNVFFISWHLVQTHVWYDGLAQDTPIWSSQWSVIIMLVAILLMENQRRGLFFGKKAGFLKETGRVMRKYHGYLFSWAIIYTFWFHPMVAEGQHVLGFLYMFLLMLQSSLFFTRVHINKFWMITLEVAVLFHGTMVAVMHQQAWPMFFFGFFGLFIVTQMHGLGLKKWQRWLFLAIYLGGIFVVYSTRGWANVNEVLRIPLGEYAFVFMLAGIIWLLMKGVNWGKSLRQNKATPAS